MSNIFDSKGDFLLACEKSQCGVCGKQLCRLSLMTQ